MTSKTRSADNYSQDIGYSRPFTRTIITITPEKQKRPPDVNYTMKFYVSAAFVTEQNYIPPAQGQPSVTTGMVRRTPPVRMPFMTEKACGHPVILQSDIIRPADGSQNHIIHTPFEYGVHGNAVHGKSDRLTPAQFLTDLIVIDIVILNHRNHPVYETKVVYFNQKRITKVTKLFFRITKFAETYSDMRLKEGLKIREIAKEKVILLQGRTKADMTRIVSLNDTSEYLWHSLEGKDFTCGTVTELLLARYDIERERAEKDAVSWVSKLTEAGLIEQ